MLQVQRWKQLDQKNGARCLERDEAGQERWRRNHHGGQNREEKGENLTLGPRCVMAEIPADRCMW